MQHKHSWGRGGWECVGWNHGRQIALRYGAKTRCWKGDCEENWLHGVNGQEHEGSKQSRAVATEVEPPGEGEKAKRADEAVF